MWRAHHNLPSPSLHPSPPFMPRLEDPWSTPSAAAPLWVAASHPANAIPQSPAQASLARVTSTDCCCCCFRGITRRVPYCTCQTNAGTNFLTATGGAT